MKFSKLFYVHALRYAQRIDALLSVSVGTVFAYAITWVLNTSPLWKIITVFPAVYLMPGLLLLLLLRRSDVEQYDLRRLIVEGFFISTFINVLAVSVFILIGVPLAGKLFPAVIISMTLILTLINYVLHKPVRVSYQKTDLAILCLVFVTFLIATIVFNILPHIPTPDEASYFATARDTVLNNESYPTLSVYPGLNALLRGGFFWTLFLASFLCSTGLNSPYLASTVSCMFLPMIALTSSLLVPSGLKDRKILQVAIVFLTLSNPLLFELSGFGLNDLAIAFYMVFATVFFVKSFRTDKTGNVSISFRYLAISILSIFTVLLIKPYYLLLLVWYLVLIVFILKYRLHKVRKYRLFLYISIIPILMYELAFDFPYVAKFWLGWNIPSTAPFLYLGSPIERFLQIFLPSPWKPITVFSQNPIDSLSYMYRLLSPEVLGLIPAGLGLALPTTLILKRIRSNIQMKVLISVTSISLVLLLILFLSDAKGLYGRFWDIPRYSLFIYPLITVVSVIAVHEAFSENSLVTVITFAIPSILLLLINILLYTSKGGVYVGWDVGYNVNSDSLIPQSWTASILMLQLDIYIALMVATKIKFISRSRVSHLLDTYSLKKKLPLILLTSVLISNFYFSAFFVENTRYFKESGLKDLNETLKGLDTKLVLSNSIIYLRAFISDDVFTDNYLISLPVTKAEFDEFVLRDFNGTTLVIINNPRIYEIGYANVYKNELFNSSDLQLVSEENIDSYGEILVYRIKSSITLHENKSDVIVKDIQVDSSNMDIPTLKIDLDSPRSANVSIIVGTPIFSKILDVRLSHGLNHLEYPFEYRLSDGRDYGRYVSERSVVIIIEANGNILYSNTTTGFQLRDTWLIFYICILSSILLLYTFSRKIEA